MTNNERNEALRLIRKGIDAEPFMLGTHTAAHEALSALAADLEALGKERDILFKGEWAALNLKLEAAERERDEWKKRSIPT